VYEEEEALALLAWRTYPGSIAQVLGSEMDRGQSGLLWMQH